jgi:hypothetical protein
VSEQATAQEEIVSGSLLGQNFDLRYLWAWVYRRMWSQGLEQPWLALPSDHLPRRALPCPSAVRLWGPRFALVMGGKPEDAFAQCPIWLCRHQVRKASSVSIALAVFPVCIIGAKSRQALHHQKKLKTSMLKIDERDTFPPRIFSFLTSITGSGPLLILVANSLARVPLGSLPKLE